MLLIFPFISIYYSDGLAQIQKGQVDFSNVPAPASHYQREYTFDTTVNAAAWSSQTKGMHVSFASADQHYFRREGPDLKQENSSLSITGWKGERLNTIILVWSPDSINQVRFLPGDLKNEKGQVINKKNIRLELIRYVLSNYPYATKDATCGESPFKNLYLMPDRFESFERFDVPGQTVRPVWVSLDVPAGTAAGNYTGAIEVKSSDNSVTLDLKVKVQNQTLPAPHEWKHRLDLWQNPWAVAWYNHVEPWSEEHKLLLKKHLKLYADAGGKYITTYAVHSPWSDNSYMIEGGMIDWIKQKSGTWKFDYKIFDEYIELAMSVGIDKAITIYTPLPGGYRFRYRDEKTGNYVYESWPPESASFKTNWKIFLTDLKLHLEKKGWFNKTYIGINESEMNQTLTAVNVIRAHSKQWKITYAGDWHPELDSLLDDYCFLYSKESDVAKVKERRTKGFTTTYYVCCNPPVPNNFVFSPPVEGRWLGWYTAAHSYDGFLRWAYEAWPADPLRDARHTVWPAGDCFLIYPGANSSIRFEKMREGIVDYEKIRIVREKAAVSTDKTVKSLLQQLDDHLKIFLAEKDFDTPKIIEDINKGKKFLEEISERLEGK